jgi:hypothetical protein
MEAVLGMFWLLFQFSLDSLRKITKHMSYNSKSLANIQTMCIQVEVSHDNTKLTSLDFNGHHRNF